MLTSVFAYIVPAAWLAICTVAATSRKNLPTWSHFTAGLLGAVVCAFVAGPVAAVVSAILAILVLIFLVMAVRLGRTTTFALPAALCGLPVPAWVAVVPGLAIAAIYSAWRIRRIVGSGYVTFLAAQAQAAATQAAGDALRGHAADAAAALAGMPQPGVGDKSGSPLQRAWAERFPLLATITASVLVFAVIALVSAL